MPVVKAKKDLNGHGSLTSERVQKVGQALRTLDFQSLLISDGTFLEGMRAVVEF